MAWPALIAAAALIASVAATPSMAADMPSRGDGLAMMASSMGVLKPWTEGAKPSFVLDELDQPARDLAAERGRVVLVHFWATWCAPCREELPALRRFVERANGRPLSVLAISVAEVDDRVRRFITGLPVNFPILLDRDRAVTKAWGVFALPTTFVLDGELTPRLVVEGDHAWDELEFDRLMAMLNAAS